MMNVWEVLKSPVVTEKSVLIKEATSGEGEKQVLTFKVASQAGKEDIKKAIEEIFNVKVSHIRTVHYEGKMKRRGRTEGDALLIRKRMSPSKRANRLWITQKQFSDWGSGIAEYGLITGSVK